MSILQYNISQKVSAATEKSDNHCIPCNIVRGKKISSGFKKFESA